jgi:dCMP deaminase
MRPTRQQMFMAIAHEVAKRSTCFRLNVGAVVVMDNRIVSIGYNGAKAGEPHCSGNACPGVIPGNCPTVHAEVNALRYLPKELRSGVLPKEIFVTHSPCLDCAAEIARYGVRRVFFGAEHARTIGETGERLRTCGIELYQLTPAGYIVRYPDKQVVELT